MLPKLQLTTSGNRLRSGNWADNSSAFTRTQTRTRRIQIEEMRDPRFVFRRSEATVGNADAVIDDRNDHRIEWTTLWAIAFSLGCGRSVLVDSRLSGAQTKFLGLVAGGRDY